MHYKKNDNLDMSVIGEYCHIAILTLNWLMQYIPISISIYTGATGNYVLLFMGLGYSFIIDGLT